MWNYYGKGGFSIKIDKDELIKEIKNLLVENNEYFIFEKVIYSKNDTIDKIPDFNNIKFYNKDDEYVLTKNIEDSGQDENVKYLLDSAKLEIFYRVYYKAYLYSIKYLLTEKTITIDANKDIICQKIFENTLNLKKSMAWKRNLSIYMLFLTALIKSNSYESEKEVRLVYFKYDIDNDCKEDKVDFFTKYTSFGNLLSPCVYLKKGDCTGFEKIIKELIISPVSKNLTIGQEVYKDTLTRFLLHNHYEGTKIKYSKHNIRW